MNDQICFFRQACTPTGVERITQDDNLPPLPPELRWLKYSPVGESDGFAFAGKRAEEGEGLTDPLREEGADVVWC